MTTREVSLTGIPKIGRATVIGALLGAVGVAVPVAIALVLFGGGPASVLAGLHVGFFGGMGFGGMLGAVIQADRFDRAQGGIDHDRNASGEREPARRAA
jgi:hypothetical protein